MVNVYEFHSDVENMLDSMAKVDLYVQIIVIVVAKDNNSNVNQPQICTYLKNRFR